MFLAAFEFNWYGFLIATGMIAGLLGAYFIAHWRGYRADLAFDVGLWAILFAILGARLYVVITEAFGGNLMDFGQILGWEGKGFTGDYVGMQGLSIYGGIIGGVLGVFINSLIYKRRKRPETFLNMLDLAAPFMILGQAIGRWGNLVNGELYGANPITNPAWQWWPFAIENGGQFYPALSFYESIFNLLGAGLLLWLLIGKRRSRPGFVVSVYFIFYGLVRACLELQRDPKFMMMWGSMPVSFFDSLLIILLGVGLIVYFIVRAKREGKRIPIFVTADKWSETGRDAFEWGRDFSKVPMPPLFKKSKRNIEAEDAVDGEIETEEETGENDALTDGENAALETETSESEAVKQEPDETSRPSEPIEKPQKSVSDSEDDSDLL